MEKELPDYFWADRLTPVNYYGYPSATKEPFYEVNANEEKDTLRDQICRFHDLKTKCLQMCVDMRLSDRDEPVWSKDEWDDNIVIECKMETGETIYVGFSGFVYSISNSFNTRRKARPYKEVKHPNELS